MQELNPDLAFPKRGVFHPVRRVKPLQAWRSMRRLLKEPEATGEVFKIVEALKGDSLTRIARQMLADETGRSMLAQKPDILQSLQDRKMLASLTEGSLGRAYLAFVESENLSADGLVEASEEAERTRYLTTEEVWTRNRLRDIHDLQHVLTGYGRDQLGELCLLSFSNTQTYNRGIAFIVFMGQRKFRRVIPALPVEACVAEGRRLAQASRWIPGMRWEDQLGRPLQELRHELGLTSPDFYRETRARWPEATME